MLISSMPHFIRQRCGLACVVGELISARGLVFLLLLSFGVSLTSAAQDEHYTIVSRPSWVVPVTLADQPARPSSNVSEGYFYRSISQQFLVEESRKYVQYQKEFLTTQGVQDGAQVSISLDPSYERLEIHQVRVRRGEEVRDSAASGNIRVVQEETDMARYLFNGRISVMVLVQDLQVGDTLEVEYTIVGENPILSGAFSQLLYLEYSVPVGRLFYRVNWPDDRSLYYRNEGHTSEPVVLDSDGSKQYTWDLRDVPAKDVPDLVPSSISPFAMVQLSDTDSWREIVNWALTLYGSVPDGGSVAIDSAVEAIRAHPTRSEQIMAALRMVQDGVRYLGIEAGVRSYQPSPPGVVFDRKFGDCKDKTMLLRELLGRVGVESFPVLVHSDYGRAIEDWLPSVNAFNHVILEIRGPNGERWYCDPTLSSQRGPLDRLYLPDYGRGLVIRPGARALSEIPSDASRMGERVVVERFDMKAFDGPVSFVVDSTMKGRSAEEMRSYLQSTSLRELETGYVNFYRRRYSDLTLDGALEFQDDEEVNELRAREPYKIENAWTYDRAESLRYFTVRSRLIDAKLLAPNYLDRELPVEIEHPVNVRHEMHLTLPRAWETESFTNRVETEAIRFSRSVYGSGKDLSMIFEYQTKTNMIAADKVREWNTRIAEISEFSRYEISDDISVPGDLEVKEALMKDTNTGAGRPNYAMFAWFLGVLVSCGIGMRRWLRGADGEPRSESKKLGSGAVWISCALLVSCFISLANAVGHLYGLFFHLHPLVALGPEMRELLMLVELSCRVALIASGSVVVFALVQGKSTAVRHASRWANFNVSFLLLVIVVSALFGAFARTHFRALLVEFLVSLMVALVVVVSANARARAKR